MVKLIFALFSSDWSVPVGLALLVAGAGLLLLTIGQMGRFREER